MDNRLKERLVGASVLVVLAVIFIPMLLDGPDSSRRIRQSVDLPPADERTTESATDRKTVRIDLRGSTGESGESGRDDEQPSAAANDEPAEVDLTAGQDEMQTTPSQQPSQSKPAQTQAAATETVETSEPVPTVVTPAQQRPAGAWTVQVGSFGNSDNADALAERLKAMDYAAFVSRYDDGSRIHFRVRVGGYATRDAAAGKADEIRQRTGEPARPAKND